MVPSDSANYPAPEPWDSSELPESIEHAELSDPLIPLAPEVTYPGESPGPENFPNWKARLLSIRELFHFGMSHREISKENLNSMEKELRDLVGNIDKLRQTSETKEIKRYLSASPQALCSDLKQVIWRLNFAMDILDESDKLDKPFDLSHRERLYELYDEIPGFLEQATEKIYQ